MGLPTVASLWCGQVAPRVVLDHSKTLNQRKLQRPDTAGAVLRLYV
jgi:hypothetical protein